MTARMDVHEDLLLNATVDREKLGVNWPAALVSLIEAHEKQYYGLAVRWEIHVLINRYAEKFFPDVDIEFAHRRFIIKALRARWDFRWRRYFDGTMRLGARRPTSFTVVSRKD